MVCHVSNVLRSKMVRCIVVILKGHARPKFYSNWLLIVKERKDNSSRCNIELKFFLDIFKNLFQHRKKIKNSK